MSRLPDLSPADIGRRVTLRALGPEGTFDTVGPLRDLVPGRAVVEARDGTLRALGWPPEPGPGLPPVVAGRVVPPDVGALDLQRIAEAGWPPEESEPLGGWVLRWAGGVTQRANSARAGGAPGRPLPEALEAVVDWYRGRGGIPTLQVPRPCHAAELAGAGWQVTRSVRLLVAPVPQLAARHHDVRVDISASLPGGGWTGLIEDRAGEDDRTLRGILTRPATVAFASVRSGGEIVGTGRATATEGWCGIACIATDPRWRRRGVASAVTSALAQWALDLGVRRCYLQVLGSNEPALALYTGLGFMAHHDYDYWQPGRPAPSAGG